MGNEFCYGRNLSKLLCAVLINMDKDETIISEKYYKYFKCKNSKEGVKQIIKNSEFYINGFPIPGTEEEFLRKTPEGYLINEKKMVNKNRRMIQSLNSYQKFTQNKSLKNSNDLYNISKDDINLKKIIKQKNENNERKIRRNSLNLKKRNINFENDIGL